MRADSGCDRIPISQPQALTSLPFLSDLVAPFVRLECYALLLLRLGQNVGSHGPLCLTPRHYPTALMIFHVQLSREACIKLGIRAQLRGVR